MHQRDEATKIEILQDAVNGYNCAREVLIQSANAEIPYTELSIWLHCAVSPDNAALFQYGGAAYGVLYEKGQEVW